jgi:hypothetical protein
MVEYITLEAEGVRRNNEQGICSKCSKEEDWSHILRCDGRKI